MECDLADQARKGRHPLAVENGLLAQPWRAAPTKTGFGDRTPDCAALFVMP